MVKCPICGDVQFMCSHHTAEEIEEATKKKPKKEDSGEES